MNAVEHAIESLNKLVNVHERNGRHEWTIDATAELAAYLEVRDGLPANYGPYSGDGRRLALYQEARKTAENLAMEVRHDK
jgi:hypothetical protein